MPTSATSASNRRVVCAQALTLAAKDGHAPVVRRLLAAGAKVEEAAVKNRPLVHAVAAHGHVEVIYSDAQVWHGATENAP